MLIPSSAKSSTLKEGEKFGLNSPCNVKPNLMFCLDLASLEAFLKSHSNAFLPVTSTADKEVSVSRGINNDVGLHACHYSLIYKKH